MLPFVKTNANNKILKQLIYTNCLGFGRHPKLNNKKINHYIFGTRQKLDIFKLYEMRYLLLKIYPLIHNLFLQARLNQKKQKKWFFKKKFDFQTKNLPKKFHDFKNFLHLKDKFNRILKEKNSRSFLPKILFATTTNLYSEIVCSAAKKCRMPFHVNRWLSGAVTAASFYKSDTKRWSFLTKSFEEKYRTSAAQNKFWKHKKNFELQKNKIRKYQFLRKPTLIIIPDISNNEMILKETNSLGIPALGLVNSHCPVEIAYPIFANDFSLYSIHFFCHFLSSLILKEFVKSKQKLDLSRKNIRSLQYNQATKDIFRLNKRVFLKKAYSVKNKFRKPYEKKIQTLNLEKKKLQSRKLQARNFQFWELQLRRLQVQKNNLKQNYRKKISHLKKFVIRYFEKRAYKKRILPVAKPVAKHFFKGKYFIEHFAKPRRRIKKNLEHQVYPKQKFQRNFKKKKAIFPKKLVLVENRKRLKKNQINFYLKKRFLHQISFIQKLRFFNFSKILSEVRLGDNKPKSKYWNKRTFWFSKPLRLISPLPLVYTLRRFIFKRRIRRKIWTEKKKYFQEQKNIWKKNQRWLKKEKYRKRWSTKKVIKGNRK